MRVRLQKFLAEAGLGSRRSCEGIIESGRVQVNGQTVVLQGITVDPEQDDIRLDGSTLKQRKKVYVALHKPRKFLCSRIPEEGKQTVFDLLPAEWGHMYPVGRLDFDSEGLLLLTNDGDFSLKITHPRYQVLKKYIAMLDGKFPRDKVASLTQGIVDRGEQLKAKQAQILAINARSTVVELTLGEGKKREIRRMFSHLGYKVRRLKRVQIGSIKIGDLPPGKWRMLQPPEINSMMVPGKKSRQ